MAYSAVPGAVFIKLLRRISKISEDFKCIFPIIYFLLFNETFYAYEKHSFIAVVWVKIEKYAFQFFT